MPETKSVEKSKNLKKALLGFAIVLFTISKSQKYFAAQQKELGGINGHVEETYAGLQVIKAYNGERNAKNEFH